MRASLVARAEEWRYSGLWRRQGGQGVEILSPWPVAPPSPYLKWVNAPLTERELEAVRRSVMRGQPYGSDRWTKQTATRLGLTSTLRPRGRPKQAGKGS